MQRDWRRHGPIRVRLSDVSPSFITSHTHTDAQMLEMKYHALYQTVLVELLSWSKTGRGNNTEVRNVLFFVYSEFLIKNLKEQSVKFVECIVSHLCKWKLWWVRAAKRCNTQIQTAGVLLLLPSAALAVITTGLLPKSPAGFKTGRCFKRPLKTELLTVSGRSSRCRCTHSLKAL